MHQNHVQCKRCRLKCLQDMMHGNMIDKSESKLY